MDETIYSCAEFYFGNDNTLNILYVDKEKVPRSVSMKLDKDEVDVLKDVLADVNFWSQITGALSAALTQHK